MMCNIMSRPLMYFTTLLKIYVKGLKLWLKSSTQVQVTRWKHFPFSINFEPLIPADS